MVCGVINKYIQGRKPKVLWNGYILFNSHHPSPCTSDPPMPTPDTDMVYDIGIGPNLRYW